MVMSRVIIRSRQFVICSFNATEEIYAYFCVDEYKDEIVPTIIFQEYLTLYLNYLYIILRSKL